MKCYELGTVLLFGLAAIIGLGVTEGYKVINPPNPTMAICQNIEVTIEKAPEGHIERRRCLDGEA